MITVKKFMQIKRWLLFIALAILVSCSNTELVENWKNPETETFTAQKVLVLAMSNDQENRTVFEQRLVEKLIKKGISATDSKGFFGQHFHERPYTVDELIKIENELSTAGYDAILVSKVKKAENKVSLVQGYRNYKKSFGSFSDDYYANQGLYEAVKDEEYYTVYHAVSTLYCICTDKDSKEIWRTAINVTSQSNDKKAIKDYIKMLLRSLQDQEILLINKD